MKIGIIGNGLIVKSALQSLKECGIEVTALWCRNAEKGRPLTEEFGIPSLYTDYDAFLQDESYDTAYNGLINSLHYTFTKKALQAGKNVICEKPLTSTWKEAADLQNTAEENGVMLLEAIMSRYSANYEAVRRNLEKIGELRIVEAAYSQYSRRYDAYKEGKVLPAFDPALSGGALYDLGIYNVHFIVGLFGAPENVTYAANIGFNGVDTSGVLLMDYGRFKAVGINAKDSTGSIGTVIQGDRGYIRIPQRPGVVKEVTLFLQEDGSTQVIDVQDEPNPMIQEFIRIREVVDSHDLKQAQKWTEQSVIAMKVLEDARKDAGIVFPADES